LRELRCDGFLLIRSKAIPLVSYKFGVNPNTLKWQTVENKIKNHLGGSL
jgi:hypothetical protein